MSEKMKIICKLAQIFVQFPAHMKKALVVGAGGQVGSDLVPLLLLSGYDVKIFDAQDYASCAAYHNLSQAYGDKTGPKEMLQERNIWIF